MPNEVYVVIAMLSRHVFESSYYQGDGKWGLKITAIKYRSAMEAIEAMQDASHRLPEGADEAGYTEYIEGVDLRN